MKELEERCESTCDFFHVDDGNAECKKDCLNNIKKHIELKNKSTVLVIVLSIVVSLLFVNYVINRK